MQNKIVGNAKQNCWQCKTKLLAMQNKIISIISMIFLYAFYLMFCPFCGKNIQVTFNYCPFCGRVILLDNRNNENNIAGDGTAAELITHYFSKGFAYRKIVLFLAKYNSVELTHDIKLRSLGLWTDVVRSVMTDA